MATRTNAQLEARERARKVRLALDAERIARDEQIDTATADYLLLADERAALLASVTEVEDRMTAPVEQLVNLGEPPRRIVALLGLDGEDAKRVRALAGSLKKSTKPATADPETGADGPAHED